MDLTNCLSGNRCRACLDQYSIHQLFLLRSKNVIICDSEKTLAEIYQQCTQLQCDELDTQLQWICQCCTEKLVEFYQFRQMCIDSYDVFKINQVPAIENITPKIEIDEDDAVTADFFETNDDYGKEDATQLRIANFNFDDKANIEDKYELNVITSKTEKIKVEQNLMESQEIGDNLRDSHRKCMNLKNFRTRNGNAASSRKFSKKYHYNVHKHKRLSRKHAKRNTSIKKDLNSSSDFKCDICEKSYSTKASIRTHIQHVHAGKKTQAIKTESSLYTKNLIDRKSNGSEERQEGSPKHPKIRLNQLSAKHCVNRIRKHQGEEQERDNLGPFKCDHCGKEFQKHHTLKYHISAKHNSQITAEQNNGELIFICDVDGCGKSYFQKRGLDSHMVRAHVDKKSELIKQMCEQCGKSFSTKAAFIKHTYTHTKVTPFQCEICSKFLESPSKLKEHMMRHNGIKNFICPICGVRKTTNHELQVHIRNHSVENRYACKLCSSVFTHVGYLNLHCKIAHFGIKEHKCPYCDRSFGRPLTLKYHVMIHTGERPFTCSICNKGFIQKISLTTHMKSHTIK